jgi:quinol monooxygenase YgiN
MASQRLYVYYRVRARDEQAVVAALRLLHARWRETAPTLQCELLRRSDEGGDSVTLMETYAGASLEALQRFESEAAAQAALWLVGPRHIEVFAPCA